MRNKKMVIAIITAAVLLMTGFVFADTLTNREGESFNRYGNDGFFGHMRGYGWSDEAREGFFGHMRGYGWSDEAREDWDRDGSLKEGYGFGRSGHCFFGDDSREDVDFDEYRENWLTERFEEIDEAVEAGEISEEEAKEYKEILEERSRSFEEEGTFERGPGRGRSRGRGHMW